MWTHREDLGPYLCLRGQIFHFAVAGITAGHLVPWLVYIWRIVRTSISVTDCDRCFGQRRRCLPLDPLYHCGTQSCCWMLLLNVAILRQFLFLVQTPELLQQTKLKLDTNMKFMKYHGINESCVLLQHNLENCREIVTFTENESGDGQGASFPSPLQRLLCCEPRWAMLDNWNLGHYSRHRSRKDLWSTVLVNKVWDSRQ